MIRRYNTEGFINWMRLKCKTAMGDSKSVTPRKKKLSPLVSRIYSIGNVWTTLAPVQKR